MQARVICGVAIQAEDLFRRLNPLAQHTLFHSITLRAFPCPGLYSFPLFWSTCPYYCNGFCTMMNFSSNLLKRLKAVIFDPLVHDVLIS